MNSSAPVYPLSVTQTRTLLSISEAIARVRKRNDLLEVICDQIQSALPFDDAGIGVLNDAGDAYYEFLTVDSLAVPVMQSFRARSYDQQWLPVDEPICKAFQTDQPLLIDIDQEARQYPNTVYLPIFQQHGLHQLICRSLRVRGQVIGVINFSSASPNRYSDADFNLFNGIADQVSVAVANILANEEILEREREKSSLLSISNAIASIRNRDELIQTITELLKPLVGFDFLAIDIPGRAANTHRMFFADAAVASSNEHTAHLTVETSNTGLPHERLYANEETLILSRYEWECDYPDYLGTTMVIQNNIHLSIANRLAVGDRAIGNLWIHYCRPTTLGESFTLLKNAANQIAVAVANILANEEILEREQETTAMLLISQPLTSIRSRQELFDVFVQQLPSLFSYDDAVMVLYDETLTTRRYARSFLPPPARNRDAYEQLLSEEIPNQGTPYEQIVQDERPTIRNMTDWQQAYPDDAGVRVAINYGLVQSLYLPLRYQNRLLGTLSLHSRQMNQFTQSQQRLYAHLADQVAVALANVLANEALAQQLREITVLKKQIEAENVYLQEEVRIYHNFSEIIGTSAALHDCLIQLGMVAPTPSTVLIGGETGTGKELIARAIHARSDRSRKPLIKINCAALPANLIESELFGHERGAFTGATDRRIGKFELAQGSTLFLDEVGELPLDLQAKLLRAIQERQIERLGSNKVIPIDVRLVAATNRDLRTEVQEGRFRADLFFRLAVFPIVLPPLRARRGDIPLLAASFVEKSNKKLGKNLRGLSASAMQQLLRYEFPGNIRELEHLIERAAIVAGGRVIQDIQLPTQVPLVSANKSTGSGTVQTLADHERAYILSVLASCNGRVSGPNGAARLLGLPATTLEAKMKKLGIQRQHYIPE